MRKRLLKGVFTIVSIKDIARQCKVSPATVSKAINGQPDISEGTRARVLETAASMGYSPNSAARALKTNRTFQIGVLFVDKTHSGLTHEYFSSLLDSFKVKVEMCGYNITFINKQIGRQSASYLEHCRYRRVDGVMIASVDFKDPQVMELVNSNIPVVTIDYVFNNRMAVLADNISGIRDLVHHVYAMGHRRIAFIHGELTYVTQNRLTSFYKTCDELGLTVPEHWIKQAVYHDTEATKRCTRELLSLSDRPSCILFPDDFSYIGGMNAITAAGLSIPEDISVVGYDGLWLSQVLSPRLTTYRQDTFALGTTAAQQLVNLIENPKTTLVQSLLISGSLLEGHSVKRIG